MIIKRLTVFDVTEGKNTAIAKFELYRSLLFYFLYPFIFYIFYVGWNLHVIIPRCPHKLLLITSWLRSMPKLKKAPRKKNRLAGEVMASRLLPSWEKR